MDKKERGGRTYTLQHFEHTAFGEAWEIWGTKIVGKPKSRGVIRKFKTEAEARKAWEKL